MTLLQSATISISKSAVERYWDPQLNSLVRSIQPGEFAVTDRANLALGTLLGSCVSACICDPEAAIGGLNHFLLPVDKAQNDRPDTSAARYGVQAMELLINEILKNGGKRSRLEAKLFGGANMMSGSEAGRVGARNQAFSLEFLEREDIPVIASDLGGASPRRVFFKPAANKVLVLKPERSDTARVHQAEARLHREAASAASDNGAVELF